RRRLPGTLPGDLGASRRREGHEAQDARGGLRDDLPDDAGDAAPARRRAPRPGAHRRDLPGPGSARRCAPGGLRGVAPRGRGGVPAEAREAGAGAPRGLVRTTCVLLALGARVTDGTRVPSTFRTLVADPPWAFGDSLPGPKRGAVKHYRTMSVEEICDFPIPELE